MRADRPHHGEGILVGKTAGETDKLDGTIIGCLYDYPGDVVSALDEVSHQHDVADALAAVGTKKSSHGRGSGVRRREWLGMYLLVMLSTCT